MNGVIGKKVNAQSHVRVEDEPRQEQRRLKNQMDLTRRGFVKEKPQWKRTATHRPVLVSCQLIASTPLPEQLSKAKKYTHIIMMIITILSKAIHCEWGDWVLGTTCSKECGTGTRTNTREKTVVEANGGTCDGQPTETVECNTNTCPSKKAQRNCKLEETLLILKIIILDKTYHQY